MKPSFFTPIRTIGVATFLEQLRNRLLLAVLVLGALGTATSFFLASISFDQTARVVQNLGLAAIQLTAVLVCVVATTTSINHDAERRVWYLLFSKPVSRAQYVLGKYLGMVLLLLTVLLTLGAVFSIGILFVDKSLLGTTWVTLFFSLLETSLIIAIATLFGCFTAPLNGAFYTFALTIVGRSSAGVRDYLSGVEGADVARRLSDVVYYVLPNLAKFDVRRSLLYGIEITPTQVATSVLYWAAYVALALWLAIVVMRKQEV
jgi:ABC-type transport system involved in multi-copper enzyme maturation permease subunit